MNEQFTKSDLFSYTGSYEDFKDGSDRYFAQLTVDFHGSSVRDNSLPELVSIGKALDSEPNDDEVP